MNALRHFIIRALTCLACAALAPALHAAAVARTGAKVAPATLTLNYPTPGAPSQDPQSIVIPLYGPLRTLLPEGLLPIWVGRTDGTPLAGLELVVSVPGDGNLLVVGEDKVSEVRVQTDANGLAVVRLTTPDPNAGGGGGGGPAP